jgi:hypothetical protein
MDQCAHCRQKEGCEKDCGGCCGCQGGKEITLSLDRRQARLLLEFSQVPFLPLCQAAGAEGETFPLFLPEGAGGTEIPFTAKTLRELSDMGLISLDTALPLDGYDYAEYNVLEPSLSIQERGSMALTPLGQVAMEQIEML